MGMKPSAKLIAGAVALLPLLCQPAVASDYETAHALVVNRKWAEATPLLKKLHAEAPQSVMIAQDFAQALLRLNQREEAMAIFRKYGLLKQAQIAGRAFITQAGFKTFQEGMNLLESRRYGEACDRFEKSLEKDLGNLEILMRLGQCKILDQNPDAALRAFDAIQKIHGDVLDAYLWRGHARALKGMNADAIRDLREAARVNPLSELAPLWLAEALQASGETGDAIEMLQSNWKKYPRHAMVGAMCARLKFGQAKTPAETQETWNLVQALLADLKDNSAATRPPKAMEGEWNIDLRDSEQLMQGLQVLSTRIAERMKPGS